MDKVIIKFTGPWRGYSAGEIAGFPEDVAQSLVDGERAELVEPKKGAKAAVPKAKPSGKPTPQPGQAGGPDATDNPGAQDGSGASGSLGATGSPDDDDPKP